MHNSVHFNLEMELTYNTMYMHNYAQPIDGAVELFGLQWKKG